MSKLLAPNGKPSKLTLEQYKLVRTPAFKKWFGDWENDPANASKVVDENGEPLVVYHGTPQKNKFYDFKIVEGSDKKSKMQLLFGSHFASNLEDAKIYSKEKGNIYEVFLNIRNILDLEEHYERSNPKFNNILEIIKELKLDKKFKNSLDYVLFTDDGDYGGLSNDIQRVFLTQQMLDSYPPKKVFDTLKKKYDGICYIPYQPQGINFRSNFSKSYIAFEPNQIKLADGSNTTFDGDNADIRFDEGGAIKKVNVVDIKQYTMGGVNYRFVEIAEKKYNKIEVYRQYEDDGKYWGVLLYRRVPKYDYKFSSSMVNNLNQLFAYSFRNSDEELFDAVKYKKKPFGSLSYRIEDSSEDEIYEKFNFFIAQCSEYNLEYSIINDKERIIFQFCQKGTFDELFNIDNLIEDYKNNGFEDVELKGIKKFRYYDLSYFLNNEWDANGLFEFPLTGLILGIPLKFTMSILNMWTTYDLSKEYKYSENVIEEKYADGGEIKKFNLLSDIWEWFGIKF
jgi:hypothetical protein